MRDANRRKRLAAVGGLEELDVGDVDRVLVNRIGVDVRVVERTLPHVAVLVDHLPGRARIVRDEDTAAVALDDGVDAAAVGA